MARAWTPLLVFVLGGAAALIEELAWTRLLTRVLGSQASATALVLAVFMTGLALGAPIGARLATGLRPGRGFAALEGLIGLWALASPLFFDLLQPIEASWMQAGAAALVLLPPTLAMGATFPLMGRLTIESAGATGARSAGFYAANTGGAALGVLGAAFVLFPWLGLSRALAVAALLDFAAAALAWHLTGAARASAAGPPADAPAARPGRARGVDPALAALATAFVLGAAALALEVLLTRLLVTLLGASTYAFALVLAAFLCGLALGSASARRTLAAGGREAARTLVARAALGLPLAVAAGLAIVRWMVGEPTLFGALQNRLPGGASALAYFALIAFLAVVALSGAAALFGAALPAAAAWLAAPGPPRGAAARDAGDRGIERALARVYTWNTAGAALGSLAAGFWLLPGLGLHGALAGVLGLCWTTGILIDRRQSWPAGLGALAWLWLVFGAASGGSPRPDGGLILAHLEGRDATIDVEQRSEAGLLVRSFRVNGNPEASSAPVDLRLQRGLSLLPAAQHGAPRRALVIGLGSGMSAGTLLSWPSIERLDVFELSAEVLPAARLFAEWNLGVLDDARTRVELGDGRHRLALSTERWDLISADPVHPWTRGANDLYSLEHCAQIAAHLAPGGIASQWLPLYQLSLADVRTVVATWCAVFPQASAWCTGYDLVLLGWSEPSAPRAWWNDALPPAALALAEPVGWRSAADLAALQVADRAALLELAAGTEPMRDDRPVLEFRAPLSYLSGYCTEALAWCARDDGAPYVAEPARARALAVRALSARFVRELPGGQSRAVAEHGARLLAH